MGEQEGESLEKQKNIETQGPAKQDPGAKKYCVKDRMSLTLNAVFAAQDASPEWQAAEKAVREARTRLEMAEEDETKVSQREQFRTELSNARQAQRDISTRILEELRETYRAAGGRRSRTKKQRKSKHRKSRARRHRKAH